MRDFLLEVGVEEVPSKELNRGLDELKELARLIFNEERFEFSEIEVYGTPRRLILLTKELQDEQKPIIKEIRGPAKTIAFDEKGKPTQAAMGFAKSQSVSVGELKVKSIENK